MAIIPSPALQRVINTNVAHSLFSPSSSGRLEQLLFYNHDVSAVTLDLYHDVDGETFDEASQVLAGQSIAAGDTFIYDKPLLLDIYGALGVKVSTANKVTVTGYFWLGI